MKLGTKFSLTTIVIVIGLSLLLEFVSFTVFSGKIHMLNKQLFLEQVDRLDLLAHEQDELFFEGVYDDVETAQKRVIDKIRIDYREQKDKVTFPFIVDSEGRVILHQDAEEGRQIFSAATVKFMNEQKEGEVRYSYGGVQNWCVFKTCDRWGWIICMTTSLYQKNKAIISFAWIALAISVAAVLLTVLIILFISGKYIEPIHLVIQKIQAIAKGEVDVNQTIHVREDTKDEIGMLANAVSKMANDLSKVTVSRDYVDNILKTIADALIVADPDGAILTVNAAALQMFGYLEGELSGQPVGMLFKGGMPHGGSQWEDFMKEGVLVDREAVCLKKDGIHMPVSFSVSCKRDENHTISYVVYTISDITERKHAEESLQRLAAIVQSSDDAIISLNLRGEIQSWNAGAEKLYGHTPEEAIGKPASLIVPPGRSGEVASYTQRILRGEHVERFETIRVSKTGRRIDVSLTVSAIKDVSGNVTAISTIAHDITNRRHMEKVMVENQKKFRAIFDQTFQFIGLITPGGTLIEVNQSALELCGVKESDVAGKPFWETPWWSHSSEMQDKLRSAIRKAAGGETVRFEAIFPSVKGDERFVDFSLKPFRNEDGQIVFLIPEARDITEEKQAARTLQEREVTMRAITSSAQDAILMIDNDGNISFWNPAAERMFGWKEEEALGKNLHSLLAPERFHEAHHKVFPHFQATGEGAAVGKMLELTGVRKDKTEFQFELSLSAIRLRDKWHAVGILRDVTERKKLELGLRESREWMSTLLKSIGDGVIATDAKGYVVFMNQVAENLTGWIQGDAIGQHLDSVFRIINEETRQKMESPVAQVLRKGAVVGLSNHTILIAKDGKEIPLNDSGAPIRNASGDVVGVVLVFQDVTERRKAEKALQESQEFLCRVTDNVPEVVYASQILPDGKLSFDFVSKGAEEIFEYEAEKLQKDFSLAWSLVVPEDVGALQASIAEIIRTGNRWHHEFRVRTPSGVMKWIRSASVPYERLEDGTTKWVGTFTDITESKQIDEDLRKSKQQLDEMANQVPGVIFQFYARPDGAMGPRYISKRSLEIFGIENDLSRDYFGIFTSHVHPDDRERFIQSIQIVVQMQTCWYFEGKFVKPSGELIWFHGAASPTLHHGEIIFNGVMMDITERKKAEEAVKAMNRELEKAHADLKESFTQLIQTEKMTALGELTAGVAHELNQPLNVTKIICQGILRDIQKGRFSEEDAKNDLPQIVTQMNKMSDIITHMRIFTRKTDGTVRTEYNISALAGDALKFLAQQFRDHNIELSVHLAEGLPDAMVDPVRIEQVLLNLLNNARYAVENSGKPEMKIELKTYASGDRKNVTIEIRDNGMGIPDNVKSKLFQPFFTTKEPGKGTGLGLSVCGKIMEEHDGKIEFDSKAGEWTVFRVVLPAKS